MSQFSIRKAARERREYLFRKSAEERNAAIQKKKDAVKHALKENKVIPSELRGEAIQLMKDGEWDDEGPKLAEELLGNSVDIDDEYRFAGVEDPKLVITTSRSPSSKLKQFAKEMKLIFPNSQRINRGTHETKELMNAMKANGVTDFIVCHETRGKPDGLIICHLPNGPTGYFTLADVVMRHDIPDIAKMSEQYPHLIFHNFKTQLGLRAVSILKYLFPVPKDEGKRVMSFTNVEDWILFRHHTFSLKAGTKDNKLSEVGPRFSMKLYKIVRGAIDQIDAADEEFVLKPYMNTAWKKQYLSTEDPWEAISIDPTMGLEFAEQKSSTSLSQVQNEEFPDLSKEVAED